MYLTRKSSTAFIKAFKLSAIVLGIALVWPVLLHAQTRIITGKVMDAATGEPLPFVNVFIKKTTTGTATDFDGKYSLTVPDATDSISATYVGYKLRTKALAKGAAQVNFQLTASEVMLADVVIRPGENPAWPIIREVLKHKDANDKRALSAFEYESYNRVEIDADNISDRLVKRKPLRKIKSLLDSIQILAGEDGKPIIPLFLSESITAVYRRTNPDKMKEKIIKTRVSGIGIQSTSIVNQMIGSSFQEYNFYNNWLNILNKFFVSPIADGWKFYYDYELKDSLMLNGAYCYRIDFMPRREQDLAFTGSMWITKADYALKQIDCAITKNANINFIERVKIQQELDKTPDGPWLPVKNRVLIDIEQIDKNTAGMLAKFYTSNKNFLVDKPRESGFYDPSLETALDVSNADESYWQSVRHDPLTVTEQNVFKMIDTVQKLPVVKSYVEIANLAVNGYKRIGSIDYGPLLYTYAFNSVEGHRVRLGLQTNTYFSNKFIFSGYGAYGSRDGRFKYELRGDYILTRKHWTVIGTRYKEDLEQLALLDNSISPNNLFGAFTRFGRLNRSRPFYLNTASAYVTSQVSKSLTFYGSLENDQYRFISKFVPYTYVVKNEEQKDVGIRDFRTTELHGEVRYAPDETWLQNQNSRISLGSFKWPVLILKYTRGINGFMHGQFNYNKYGITLVQSINMGYLGRGRYAIDAGLIPSRIPYPLLRAHLGNQTIFYNASSFNLMNYFEFISDRWVQMNYQHYFEGLGFNSLPVVRKWNLRLLATGNILMGELGQSNQAFLQSDSVISRVTQPVQSLGRRPYVEVGYGVENIFRLLRVDFIHRLTYLSNPGAKPFGVKFSLQFKI